MIIKREYVTFQKLINTDIKTKELLIKAFNQIDDKNIREQHFDSLRYQCLYQREMGWGLPDIRDIIDGFEELDKEYPYDNGLTYEDVNDVEIIDNTKDSITLLLKKSWYGYVDNVQLLKINR